MITFYFIVFIAIMLAVGIYSHHFSKDTSSDYLLASRSVPPWQTAFSAIATQNSGFMYIGLIGFTWVEGVSGIWLIVGIELGCALSAYYLPRRIHQLTTDENALSFKGLLSSYNKKTFTKVKFLVAVITVSFLSLYAAAQLNAGGKTLHVLLSWEQNVGIIIGYVVVLAYCFSGGIRASIWTDSMQLMIMIISMMVLVVAGLESVGGIDVFLDSLGKVSPEYSSFFPSAMGGVFSIMLIILGWFGGGLGVNGQPHIVVRYMAFERKSDWKKVFAFFVPTELLFVSLAFISALVARVYFFEHSPVAEVLIDPEVALPRLAMEILPPAMVGLVLAGIFSSIVSTADSQLLSSSAAIGVDLIKPPKDPKRAFWQNKISTVFISTLVLIIALNADSSVFSLVMMSWSALAAAFAPLLIFRLLTNYKISEYQALLTIIVGLSVTMTWYFTHNSLVYNALIGIVFGSLTFLFYNYMREFFAQSSNAK
jgi:SSS family transporter